MRVCFWICSSFLFANIITGLAAEHEHDKNVYANVCETRKIVKDPPSIDKMKEMQPKDGGYRTIIGCKMLRHCYAKLLKPDMDFKTEADYEGMCKKTAVTSINKNQVEGVTTAFKMNTTWSCTENSEKGSDECVVKSVKPGNDMVISLYYSHIINMKHFVLVVCNKKEKMAGWEVLSIANSLTDEETKMVDEHVKSLGFDPAGKGTMHCDKCM